MYKGGRFSRRPLEHILRDIDALAEQAKSLRRGSAAAPWEADAGPTSTVLWNWYQGGMRSVFLQDADPLLVRPAEMLVILRRLRERFPSVHRVTTYARSKSLARLSVEELTEMREAGLDRIHVGFESGCDEILAFMSKGASKELHTAAGLKVKAAGMELSAYYMPGLGGRALWRENALETADLMNRVDPDFIRLRTLAVPEVVPLAEDLAQGRFEKANDVENAREIMLFLESLSGIRATVVSDHILNISQDIEGKLPEDRESMLNELRAFLAFAPEEQVLYRVGRRRGLFVGVSCLRDPARRMRAERLCREMGAHPGNIDEITDRLVKRFV